MTAKVPYPSLGSDGWVQTTLQTADYLLQDIFLSDYSQTFIYNDHVFSLAQVFQENQNDVAGTTSTLRDRLTVYFSRYFNDVEVEVTFKEDPDDSNKASVTLFIFFKDNEGKEFNLSKAMELVDFKVKRIFNYING